MCKVLDAFPKQDWIDPLPTYHIVDEDEALVRIRFTNLKRTGEMVYAVSWLHALGKYIESHHI